MSDYSYHEIDVPDFDGTWQSDNECYNIYAAWCGDGVVDTGHETCDPAAPGYTPETCSVSTCTPIVTPPTS